MALANIKIDSKELERIKSLTGENTGQKAVQTALNYFYRMMRQRGVIQELEKISFKKGFDPKKLRERDR